MTIKNPSGISRRSFLQWSSALTAMATIPVSQGLRAKLASETAPVAPSKGEWKPAACWHNCGGRCMNKVLVVDGVVERQKTDDTHPDSHDYFQQRSCVRGRAQRTQVFGADRIKYPMKRKNWAPGGGDRSLRGRDQWVRISWDEALDIVVSETKRITEKHGQESLWVTGNGTDYQRTFAAMGGYTTDWGTTSRGAWTDTPGLIGVDGAGYNATNDRIDVRSCELIVLWGINPAWSSAGSPTWHYMSAKKAGAKFINIDPSYTETANRLEADWVPINLGTDHALALGLMHTLLVEDDPRTNPLIDWNFLDSYTIGFDREHMPDDANPNDNFKDYLLGTFDNQPKDAVWAAEICGIEPEMILNLARQIGGTKKVALIAGWAPARTHQGEGWVQAFSILGMMTGHMGQPGRMTGVCCHTRAGGGGPLLVREGKNGLPAFKNPIDNRINHNEIFQAVLEGRYRQKNQGEKKINIQMIFHSFNATLQTRANINQGIEAHRKVEFVVTPAYVLTTNAKYSDVVLPITTEWEREGMILVGNREILLVAVNIVNPMYEAKSDQWVARELAKRLELNEANIFPISEKQQFFNKIATSTVVHENGKDFGPLVTITDRDLAEWGVTGQPQQGKITLKDFLQRGCYQVERKPGDNYGYIAYKDFIDDPEGKPLKTQSGKFEIYCQAVTDNGKAYGWEEVPQIPKYIPKDKGYEETFEDWATKKKGKYPFQLYNPHYLRRSHTILDNVPWLREMWPNPVFLNGDDAQSLGIKNEDTVLIETELGKTLRKAHLTQTLKPGTVGLPHGSWPEIDESNGIDLAGADNIIFVQVATGFGTSGWNSVICNVKKWDGKRLEDDVKWPQRIIFNEKEA